MFKFYKSYEQPTLFEPKGLVCSPFLFPKSVLSILGDNKRPYLYVFDRILTNGEEKELNLEGSIVVTDISTKEELKNCMKDPSFWKLISLF